MKKIVLLSCALLWVTACGGPEAPEPLTPEAPIQDLVSQGDLAPTYWYTCQLPCRAGFCPTSSIPYPDCSSGIRYTCTPCIGGPDPL
jgi:hypothetical protein